MRKTFLKIALPLVLVTATSCHELFDLLDELEPSVPEVSTKISGLTTPIALETDRKSRLWVAEVGTGNNDGKISVTTPDGQTHTVVEGFVSVISEEDPTPIGLNHLLLTGDILWILHGVEGKLYQMDVSAYTTGDDPKQASELVSEDIASFVLAYDFEPDTQESNPYNLAVGPEGDLYIADAAANAIIKREVGSGALSVFATIPGIDNPTEVGPPVIDGVPTGIAFDGKCFYVSTLIGFPFPEDEAILYKVDTEGNVSVFQEGFTTMVDVELGMDHQPVVLEFARWSFEQGFAPMSGNMVRVDDGDNEVLVENLNFPTDIHRHGVRTYYVTDLAGGKVLKIKL